MYCVKCGVKLSDGVSECPLCQTRVAFYPSLKEEPKEPAYPSDMPRHYSESNLPGVILVTVFFALAAAVITAVCLKLYGEMRWGGFVLLGLAFVYAVAVLPAWFRRPKAVVFVPVAHAAAAGYLLYICHKTGGSWFLSFAFPLICLSCIFSVTAICLLKYVKSGRVFIIGGLLIAFGGFTVLAELFEHLTFKTDMFRWSLFSLAGFGAAGLCLLIAGSIRPLRRALQKRFFF